jgi:hypothetical protein
MVLKQGPNKHIIGCHKIQNFQFEGETNRMLISKGLLLMIRPPYPKFWVYVYKSQCKQNI